MTDETYLKHIEDQHGTVALRGLVGKRAFSVPLADVYVSLSTKRPDLEPQEQRAEGNLDRSADGDPIARLAQHLGSAQPKKVSKKLLMDALRTVGVPSAECDRDDTLIAVRTRLQRLKSPGTESVRAVLETVDIEGAMRRAHNLVIEGDPGAGKTTALRHIAMALFDAHGGKPAQADAMGFTAPYPFPVVVTLLQFAQWIEAARKPGIPLAGGELLARYIDEVIELVAPKGAAWFRSRLDDDHIVVLLDGLDEVADADLRPDIARIVIAFLRSHKGCRFVVTSRPAGLSDDILNAFRKDLGHTIVRPLDDHQIDRFVRAWYGALLPAKKEADAQADELLRCLHSTPRVALLARSPILLTAIAVVHVNEGGHLPEGRAELYEQCVQALGHSWDKAKGIPGSLESNVRVRLLQEFAYRLQETGNDEAALEPTDVEQAMRGLGRLSDDGATCVSLVDELAERSGLLTKRKRGYRFVHPTFREFLAARRICSVEERPADALAAKLYEPWWREVILLAVAYQAMGKEAQGRGLVRELLQRVIGDGSAVAAGGRMFAFHTLAQALTELQAAGVDGTAETIATARNALIGLFDDATQPGDLIERIGLAEKLGYLGDPRLDPARRCIEVPAGPYWGGPEGHERSVEVGAFFIQRWPVTIGEYRDFVAATAPDVDREEWKRQCALPPNLPVVSVSFDDAQAYCAWLTASGRAPDGCVARLPTADEWGKAARGGLTLDDGQPNPDPQREYPWVGPFAASRANGGATKVGRVVPVGCFVSGHGPNGTWDQAGNVWEWTMDEVPWFLDEKVAARAVRGGCFWSDRGRLRVSYRLVWHPAFRFGDLGFRCVAWRAPRP